MLRYDIKINVHTIYAVQVRRLDDLTSMNKSNNYIFYLFDESGIFRFSGNVKHKYKDGVFVLMNKVNKEIDDWMKDRPETKLKIKRAFNQIKMGQNLLEVPK